MTEVYLTIKEVADRLKMSYGKSNDSAVRRMMHKIPGAFKLGKGWRISEADLERYIASLKIKSGG